MKTWTTITGEEIPYNKLTDSHLKNILRWIESRAETGMTLKWGGGGWDIDDMWYDEEYMKGKDVLDYYNYKSLLKEAWSRKTSIRIYKSNYYKKKKNDKRKN